MSTRWCKCQNKRAPRDDLESCLLVFPCFLVSEPLPVWTQLMLIYGTLTPSHHHLLHTVCAIYWLIDASPLSARVCVWTRCDLSAGLSMRVCASCNSVCWQLNQHGLDEWPANHCRHSVAIAIAHRELSLGFPEEQTSHNLILKSICLLVSIWLSPLSLSFSPLPLSAPFIHPTVSYCAQLVIYFILH